MKNFTITGFADEIGPNLDEQIRVLKSNGISYMELRGINGKNVGDFTLSEATQYKKQLDEYGIQVSSIGSPIGKIGIHDDFEAHLIKFEHVLKVAEIFDSPYIRMFSFFIADDENADDFLEEVVDRWQQFLAMAHDYPQITLLHENEKEIFGDTPERCLTLVERLDNPQMKLAFDPANFVQCGVEVYPHAFEMLKNHIAYMHIKDARYSDDRVTPAGYGDGHVQDVLEALVARDFYGFASLEPHLTLFDGFAALEKEDVSIEPGQSDGATSFTVASNALKDILVDKMKQQWQ